jgi:tRNA G37 N-methylase Trm5
MVKITELSHKLIQDKTNVSIAVDMTCGRGNDTLFLAHISKTVYAFDIQNEAIDSTKLLLEKNNIKNVFLTKDSHLNVKNYLFEPVDIFFYNLGYLPNGDKSIVTEAKTTLKSLKTALSLLNEQGIIILVMYPHNQEEIKLITDFASELDISFDCVKYEVLNRIKCPHIIQIKKG